jgi:HD superfamily phosphohydrolase
VTQILEQQLVTYGMDRKSMFWSVFFHKAIHVYHRFMQKIFSTVIVADLLPKRDNMSKLPHDK